MFKGSLVALITPFTNDGEVDFRALRDLIEWHIESKTDGIVLCGTTGEAPTLSHEETIKIFKEAVYCARGRIPIIAGTGSYNTKHAFELTSQAKEIGCDAALVIIPYYSRPTPEGVFQHFQVLNKAELPMIVYHHPTRIGIKLPVKALARIAELPYVAAIKDATADLDYAIELLQLIEKPLLSGDDTLVVPLMAIGAVGVVSIVANLIPKEWRAVITLLGADEVAEGRELFHRFYPLAKSLVIETNPMGIKYAMGAVGKCSSQMRLPLVEPLETTQEKILSELQKIGLIQDACKVC